MIRAAREEDAAGVRGLMQSVEGFWNAAWREDVLERAIRAADGLAFVYEVEGRIVGFVCAHDLGTRAYLNELVVAEEMRGQGVGKMLVERVEEALHARGCGILIADVWKDAVGFYAALGWSPPDVVLMRKRL